MRLVCATHLVTMLGNKWIETGDRVRDIDGGGRERERERDKNKIKNLY